MGNAEPAATAGAAANSAAAFVSAADAAAAAAAATATATPTRQGKVDPDLPAACGPVPARTSPAEPVTQVYFFGIIDILQQYNIRKTAETFFRSMVHSRHGISAVPPGEYATRFIDFIDKNTE
jgi:hypothetical protein